MKEMEAPAKKWFPKWEPKVTPNGPLPGRPDERKHNEFKGFLLKTGPPGGPFWAHFGGPKWLHFWTPKFREFPGI